MLSKFKINLIFLLCMLSLVSIGFSSWSITLDAINVDANISVDNVVNSEDYIYLDTTKGDNNTVLVVLNIKIMDILIIMGKYLILDMLTLIL
ncbi:MAG: hypothetical protein ACLUG4_06010 [Bacilli bacterium]